MQLDQHWAAPEAGGEAFRYLKRQASLASFGGPSQRSKADIRVTKQAADHRNFSLMAAGRRKPDWQASVLRDWLYFQSITLGSDEQSTWDLPNQLPDETIGWEHLGIAMRRRNRQGRYADSNRPGL